MPKVPTYDAPTVQLRPVTDAKAVAAGGYASGGAAIAQGLGGVVHGLQQAAEIAAQRQDTLDEAYARDKDAQLSDQIRQATRGDGGIFTLQGKAAVDGSADATARVEDIVREAGSDASTPQQRLMVARVAAARRESTLGQISEHVDRQANVYAETASAARIDALGQDAMEAPDEDRRAVSLLALQGAIRDEVGRKGLGNDVFLDQWQKARSNVYVGVVDALLDDPAHAMDAYRKFEQVKGYILPDARPKLGNTVIHAVNRYQMAQFGMQMAMGNVGMSPISPSESDGDAGPPGDVPDVPDPKPTGAPLKLAPPIPGGVHRITSGYGMRVNPVTHQMAMHTGTDVAVPEGTPVHAMADGVVTFAGMRGNYGNQVRIRHSDGIETSYSHLSAVDVKVGQHVSSGDEVAAVGHTGRATGPHLHVEVWDHGVRMDPEQAGNIRVHALAGGEQQQAQAPGGDPNADGVMPAVHTALGGRKPDGSLDQKAVVRAAMMMSGGNPLLFTEAMREIRSVEAQNVAAKNAEEKASWDAAQPYLQARPAEFTSIGQVPGRILATMSPQQVTTLKRTADNNADAVKQGTDRVTDIGVFNRYYAMALAGDARTLLAQNVAQDAANLSGPDMQKIIGLQHDAQHHQGMFKPDIEGSTPRDRVNLAAAKILPAKFPKDDAETYKSALFNAVAEAERRNEGKPLDQPTIDRIAGNLFSPVRSGGMFGVSTPLYKFSTRYVPGRRKVMAIGAGGIPQAARQQIGAAWARRHPGVALPEATLEDIWRNGLAVEGPHAFD